MYWMTDWLHDHHTWVIMMVIARGPLWLVRYGTMAKKELTPWFTERATQPIMHRVRAGCTPTHDGQVLHRPLDRPIMTPTSLGKSLGEKRMLNIYFVHWEIKKLWRNTHLKWHNDQETWDAERTLYMTLQRLWEFCPASYSRKDNEYRW